MITFNAVHPKKGWVILVKYWNPSQGEKRPKDWHAFVCEREFGVSVSYVPCESWYTPAMFKRRAEARRYIKTAHRHLERDMELSTGHKFAYKVVKATMSRTIAVE